MSITPEIARFRARGWPDKWRGMWDERAAIMEFDGGLTRDEADVAAYEIIEPEMKRAAA